MKGERFAIFVPDPGGDIAKKLAEMAAREKRTLGSQVAMLIEREFNRTIAQSQSQPAVVVETIQS